MARNTLHKEIMREATVTSRMKSKLRPKPKACTDKTPWLPRFGEHPVQPDSHLYDSMHGLDYYICPTCGARWSVR